MSGTVVVFVICINVLCDKKKCIVHFLLMYRLIETVPVPNEVRVRSFEEIRYSLTIQNMRCVYRC